MGLEDCIDEIIAIWEEMGVDPQTMGRDDAKAILESFNSKVKGLNRTQQLEGINTILLQAQEQRVFRNQLVELHNKQNTLLQAYHEELIGKLADNLLAKGVPAGDVMRNILDRSNTDVRNTVSNLVAVRRMQAVGGLEVRLKEEDLLHYLTDPELDGDIIRAYEAVAREQTPDSNLAPEAVRVAEILHEHAKVVMDNLTRHGSYFSDTYQFMFGIRGLTPASVKGMSAETFVDVMTKEIGIDMDAYRQMDTGVDIEEYLEKIYEKTKDREFAKAPVGKFDGQGGGVVRERYKNFAASTSSQLNLPLSAESYIRFKERFMEGVPTAGVVYNSLDLYGRAWGLMETLGPVPKRTLQNLEAKLSRLGAKKPGKFTFKPDPNAKWLVIHNDALDNVHWESMLDEMTGEASIPEDLNTSRLFNNAKMFTSVVRLSHGVFSQVTDLPIKMATLHTATGQHALTTLANHFGSLILESPLFSTASKAERRLLAQRLLVPIDSFNRNIVSEAMGANYQPGIFSKMLEYGFNANGMGLFDRAGRMADTEALANSAAEIALGNKAYADMQATLNNYGISHANLPALREAIVEVQGVKYVVPDRMKNSDLQGKYASMLMDIRNISTPTPTVGEKAALRGGVKKGTLPGEVWGLFTQFKAFPVTITRSVMPRIAADQGMAGVMTTMVGMVFFAMIGDSLRQLAKGREPITDYTKVTNVSNILIRSGFGGLFGDMLFNRYSDHSGSFLERTQGPTAGVINDVASLYSTLTTGFAETGEIDVSAIGRTAVDYTPGINLWYFQWALENSIQHVIMEAANPGSTVQAAQRIESITGQGVGPFKGSLIENL